jgi:hypothetical protein
MEQRLSKATIDLLTGPMRPVVEPKPTGKVSRSSQLYGFIDPPLKEAFVAKVKQFKLVNANVIIEGFYAWLSSTEWSSLINQWVREHQIELIRNGIVKHAVFTARVGALAPPELHARIMQAIEETSMTVQDLLYVVVQHFVCDDTFAQYIAEQAINRKIAALDGHESMT